MKSFQTLYTFLQNQTGDDATARLTIFKEHINDTQRKVMSKLKGKYRETTVEITTVASTGRYELPADIDDVIAVKTTEDSGETYHRPTRVHDPEFWDYLVSLGSSDSDVPKYWYVEGNDLLLYPDYSSASDTIVVRYRQLFTDMSLDDYTTGTITDATNGDETITGSGSTWTGRKPVLNQYIRLTPVSGKGDYRWYKISSITDATNLELEKKYLGATFTTGAATYAMGEMPYFPGEFHELCVYRPLALYYAEIEDNIMSAMYWKMYDGGKEAGLSTKIGGLMKELLDKEGGMNEFAYWPPEGKTRENTPEEDSLSNITGESW